jgi:hydroxyethylthiazole kinase
MAVNSPLIARLREKKPRIHCITNPVAQNLSANVLLAVGANPSLTINPHEVQSFVSRSDALLINLGMMDEARKAAIPLALQIGKPWVLDPVFVQDSPARLAYAQHLLKFEPQVLRCNVLEAEQLHFEGVMAITGAEDKILHQERVVLLQKGSPLMAHVTGMGCALSALIAAFLSVEEDAFLATQAALMLFGEAGERAGKKANGPGSFVPLFLDELYHA